MRKGLFVLVMVGMVVAMVACSAPAAPAPAPTAAGAQKAAAPAPSGGGAKKQLVVSGWGGTWQDAMTAAVIKPFEEKFNAEVTVALPGSSTQILSRLRAEKGNPSVDVMLIGGQLEAVAAKEGLMEEIDWAKQAPNWNDLIPEAKTVPGYGPSIASSGIGLSYNTQKMPFTPTSWMDFWDPRLKDHVAIFNIDANYGLAHLVVVDEVLGGKKGAQPDLAFAKFKELMTSHKPIIMANTDDAATALVQRDAWLVPNTNSRWVDVLRQGFQAKFFYPKEGGFVWGNFAGVPKGSKSKDLAVEFVNFYMDPKIQADWASKVNYGPTNKKADLSSYQYGDALIVKDIRPLDWDFINANRAAWIERFNKEVLPLLK